MRTLALLLIPVAALSSIACGGTGDSATTGTGAGTGAGGMASTTASTSTGTGQGGAGGGAATSGSATSSGSGTAGTGGSSACSGFIDVTENNEVTQHFASICAGSWGANETMTAVGYHFSGGVAPGVDQIEIDGCASMAVGSARLHLTTPKVSAPGTFTEGSASYTDGVGAQWSTGLDPYNVVITKLDMPGGVIEGTFNLSVTGPTDGMKALKGSFHVCRVADENAP
jgi:hypothetical protein